MARRAVGADPPDLGALVADVVVEVPELAGLGRAAGRVVLGIEVDQRPAAAAGPTAGGSSRSRPEARPRGPGRRRQACSSRQPSRGRPSHQRAAGATTVSTTTSSPERIATLATGPTRTFDRPRAGPIGSGLVDERPGETVGRDAVDAGPERQERDEVARRGRAARAAPGPRMQRDRGVRPSSSSTGRSPSAVEGEEPDVGEQVVGPAAEPADDRQGVRATGECGADRQLGVRLVLGLRRDLDRDPGGAQPVEAVRARSSRSRRRPGRGGARGASAVSAPPSTAITSPAPSAQPGHARSSAVRSGGAPAATIRARIGGAAQPAAAAAGRSGSANRRRAHSTVVAAVSVAPAARSSAASPRTDSIPTARTPAATAIRMSSGVSPT